MTSRYSKGFSASPGRQASLVSGSMEQSVLYEDVHTNMMNQIVAHEFAFRQGHILLWC